MRSDGKSPKELDIRFKKYLSNINNIKFAKIEVNNNREEIKYEGIVPEFTDAVMYKEFRVERSKLYQDYIKKQKELAKGKKKKQVKKKEKEDAPLSSRVKRNLVNWINGIRSITKIRDYAAAETGKEIDLKKVIEYFELLEKIGWIHLKK